MLESTAALSRRVSKERVQLEVRVGWRRKLYRYRTASGGDRPFCLLKKSA